MKIDSKINQKHSKEIFLFATSRILERASFYGLRSLIILYMIGETLKMPEKVALGIYGWFAASIMLSQIIGAIIGDLLIGNKKSIIIGGLLQAIGAFTLCIPSSTGLYTGLVLFTIGNGLYSPNIISKIGKLYLQKTKLLDAAFTIFYLAVNIGAFLGVLGIAILGEMYGWEIGFIAAGVTMLLSLLPIIFSKEKEIEVIVKNDTTISYRIKYISLILILIGLYWGLYHLGDFHFHELELEFFKMQSLNITSYSIWASITSVFSFFFSILLIILWSLFFKSHLFKITIGFISFSLSYAFLLIIPSQPLEFHLVFLILSLLFLNISEILIAPLIYSTLTKYTNPKYLTILVSLAFIPSSFFIFIFSKFDTNSYEDPKFSTIIAFVSMVVISIGLIVFKRARK